MKARPRRRLPACLAVVVVAAPLASCGILPLPLPLPPEPEPTHSEPAELVAPLSLIPVADIAQGDCPDDADDGYEDDTSCYTVILDEAITVTTLAAIEPPEQQDSWTVAMSLEEEDAAALEDLTAQVAQREEPGNQIAIILDDDVVSAPAVIEAIPGGQLSVGFSEQADAEELFRDLTEEDD